MTPHDDAVLFEQARPNLLGLAYRILGSHADAEDAVQDTFLKWRDADHAAIENPGAWLTTACTRRCLDLLRSAHKTRVSYVGTWLPEPILTTADGDFEDASTLASSMSTAFLLMLERLTPKERAAYLLHEIFDVDYSEIARTLEIQEAACRKLVSRARDNIQQSQVRSVVPMRRQEQLLAAFEQAVATGSAGPFANMLSEDIRLSADGGGKVAALGEVLEGKALVLDFITDKLHLWWPNYRKVPATINGNLGLLLQQEGATVGVVSFSHDAEGRMTGIYVMRNPDKLARLDETVIH
ncbi:RNA polymerase sigma factor SigJ [Luteimonas panaciterrae]|uniref:RNA polymerase sigma factor SigJ n=1 Tax=Luteimonas panaciterrae TaxID=363885 RepID=UPI001CF9FBC6|nr:RNA polymerase sigma factor SigJ [Luteimonas panaciterrae]